MSRKLTISLPDELATRAVDLAERSGLPVSGWIARAVADRARVEDGLAAVQEWEAENEPLRPDELARARLALAEADAAMLARPPAR